MVKIARDAVGGRRKPQNGLPAWFEADKSRLKTTQFSNRLKYAGKRTPTAEAIFTIPAAKLVLTNHSNYLLLYSFIN